MYRLLTEYFANRFLSKWIVFIFDIAIVSVTFHYAYLIRFGFDYTAVEHYINVVQPIFVLSIYILFFFLTSSYSGIIRHSGIDDATRIIKASIISGIVVFIFSDFIFSNYLETYHLTIPKGVIIIHSLLVLLSLILSRLFVRTVFNVANNKNSKTKNVVIYGAGSLGTLTYETLMNDKRNNYVIKSFIDDNKSLIGKQLLGKVISSQSKVLTKGFVAKNDISELIIAVNNMEISSKNIIIDKCLELGVQVRKIPSVDKWVNGELSSNQIKEVRIEDLLERPTIVLENQQIIEEVKGNTVLVTGAAGSIGSEIVRQLVSKEPSEIILFEQAESPLHDLRIELGSDLAKQFPNVEFEFVIGDIRNREFVFQIFKKHNPEIVFHAAAYKHVPLMEEFPQQAVATNIAGTKNVADAAVKFSSKKFVMVSTDKAVNPTNVMGASKRIAEIYIQSLSKEQDKTKFITTRFGNVLGSNGSVIPMFKRQIEAGGPLTVTHKDITRYFMTIPEACQLVLEAGAMGKGGEIFVFDMGKSVKIFDVAKKVIQLSGYSYPDEIDIVFTGLRPGEKLYEELLATKEGTVETYHPKIMVANIREIDYSQASTEINELITKLDEDSFSLVRRMKSIVPEFISNNSKFEELD